MNPHGGRPPRMNFQYQQIPPYYELYQLINDLSNPTIRCQVLDQLSKRRDVPELGLMLWHSFGTVSILLQEVVNVYPALNPPILSAEDSTRACNALALLQCIAEHPETRPVFLAANVHRFIYPLLEIVGKTRPLEFLKLTSLGVIGSLVRNDDEEVVNFLLTSEIIPSCLRNMEYGCVLSKTVATYILQRILVYDNSLNYVCQTYERFSHVALVLANMVQYLVIELPQAALSKDLVIKLINLLKHMIRCYWHLSRNSRAREALRQCLPVPMKDNTFFQYLDEKDPARIWLVQLLQNIDNLHINNDCMPYAMPNMP